MTGIPDDLRASERDGETPAGGSDPATTPPTKSAPETESQTAEPAESADGEPAQEATDEAAAAEPEAPATEVPAPESAAPQEAAPEAPAEASPQVDPIPQPATASTVENFGAPTLPNLPPTDWADAPEEDPRKPSRPAAAAPAPEPAPAPPSAPASSPAPAPPPPLQPKSADAAAPQPEPAASGFVPGLPGEPTGGEEVEDEGEPLGEEELQAALLGFAPEVVELHPGDRRTGTVISVNDDAIVVDVGGKTEGVLSLRNAANPEQLLELEPGQEIEVQIARLGEPGEYVQLALLHDENNEAWEALEEAFREKRPVIGKVTERVKGGLTVDIGLPAFLPGSQASVRPQHDLDTLVGDEFEVLIVKLSRRRSNIVVSRRELLEQELGAIKQETLSKLSLGAVVTGRIKNVTSYGAFVDLGGIDGLIHVTDISHGRVKDPSQALQPGEEVTAKVVKFDPEKERVSLSLKDMQEDPWATVEERFHEGDKVTGKVASVTDYGAFVELEPGVEGLIHITEMSWSKRLKHPSKVVQEGQEVDSVVLKVQPQQRRISLSLKQIEPDPWSAVGGSYQVGSVVEGRVRNVTTYGVFVEIDEGVDGLIHVSDLSWDSRVRNPKEVVKKGQQLRAVVLNVDIENRRMSLGVKQLEPDIWETFFTSHVIGEIVAGRPSRMVKFGAFVELAPGVEGLCHNSEMPARRGRGKGGLQVGKAYEFEIIKMDEFEKRVGLRCLSYDPLPEEQPEPAAPPPAAPDLPPVAPVAGETSEPVEPAAAPEAELTPESVVEAAAEPVAGAAIEQVAESASGPAPAVDEETPAAAEAAAEEPESTES